MRVCWVVVRVDAPKVRHLQHRPAATHEAGVEGAEEEGEPLLRDVRLLVRVAQPLDG